MRTIHKIEDFPRSKSIKSDPSWNFAENKELKMHQIHAYPAKFPAFIASKAIEFVNEEYGFIPKKIADIFCGCGTTAFEAKREKIDFWGCDINPVATLIARVKSEKYDSDKLGKYFEKIMQEYNKSKFTDFYIDAPERLKYWYLPEQYNELMRLKKAIEFSTPANGKYKEFFLCAFSNILKPTSKWLTKSIKPQIDPDKEIIDVIDTFKKQFNKMNKACTESNELDARKGSLKILDGNFLDKSPPSDIDMIITSPPYVTSYEYADLHQLSSLWLGYTNDYRELRKGTIGSSHNTDNIMSHIDELNDTGRKIINKLISKNHKPQARAITRYFLDMQKVAGKCFNMLGKGNLVFFVIGNTEYKGTYLDNARHLSESLFIAGFSEIGIIKRNISSKILTPYRDKTGRFSSNPKDRKIYTEEFIIIGRK